MRRPLNALLRSRAVSAVTTPHDVDDYLALLDPAWSVREVRARIVRVQREAGGATSLWLEPNENWRGFRAGQFVRMGVDVAGVRHQRCFSISSAPEDGWRIRVTLRALPGGHVGTWAMGTARAREVIGLSQALGDFVLPSPAPPRLLFVSGGSGITPIVSLVRHLFATGYSGEAVCLHYAREEPTLGVELTALACRHPGLRFVPVVTARASCAAARLEGHVSVEHLQSVAPWWRKSEIYVCGPPALEAEVERSVGAHGQPSRLHVERFASAPRAAVTGKSERCRLTFVKSGLEIEGDCTSSLLEQAERAGLAPAHGCRMGVCHGCKHRKLSGVVRNTQSGALGSEPDEEIQLCVSVPCSAVTLDL